MKKEIHSIMGNTYAYTQQVCSKLYAQAIQDDHIPMPAGEQHSAFDFIIRNSCLDIKEVYSRWEKLKEQDESLKKISVLGGYADCLSLSPQQSAYSVGEPALQLVARRIEVSNGGHMLLKPSEGSPYLLIYTQEIVGSLIVKSKQGISQQVSLAKNAIGVMVSSDQNGTIAQEPILTPDTAMLHWNDPVYHLLLTQFHLAASLLSKEPLLAQSLLTWIISLTTLVDSDEARVLSSQAKTLLARLVVDKSTVFFVPALTQKAYEEEIKPQLKLVQLYEDHYQKIIDKNEQKENTVNFVKTMISQARESGDNQNQLISQAQSLYEERVRNADDARKMLERQRYLSEQACITFQGGLRLWKIEKEREALFAMAGAVFDFVAAVGSAVATGGASSGGAAQAAIKTVKTATEIYEKLSKLKETLEKIWDLIQKLHKMITSINGVLKSSNPSYPSIELPSISATHLDVISGQAEWDAFLEEVKVILQPFYAENVSGVAEYEKELRKLAIYGKASLLSEASVAKTGLELARLKSQRLLTDAHRKRLTEYVSKLTGNINQDTILIQQLFMQGVAMKFWLYMSLQNYLWAYRYETLKIYNPAQLKLTQSGEQYQKDFVSVIREMNNDRSHSRPQRANINLVIEDVSSGPYKNVVRCLKEKKETTFFIDLNEEAFEGSDRVRLKLMRCVLQGVTITAKQKIKLMIKNAGIYSDRRDQQTYLFSAPPLAFSFWYRHAIDSTPLPQIIQDDKTKQKYAVEKDGAVEEDEQRYYYKPTPFTQWTLRVLTPGLDLSKLDSIKLEFQAVTLQANDGDQTEESPLRDWASSKAMSTLE